MDFQNPADLQNDIEAKIKKGLQETTADIISIFREEFLVKYVYASSAKNPSRENSIYHDHTGTPTGEFMNAWEWSDISRIADALVTQMWYNPEEMSFDTDTFLHGSIYSSPEDVTANLPAILEGEQSSLWLSVNRKRKFWEAFVEEMIDKKRLEKIIIKNMASAGVPLVRL